jgi:hypothetical protein
VLPTAPTGAPISAPSALPAAAPVDRSVLEYVLTAVWPPSASTSEQGPEERLSDRLPEDALDLCWEKNVVAGDPLA